MNIEIIEELGKLKIYFPHDKNFNEVKNILGKLKNQEIEVVRTDRLSLEQSKLIWVLCRDYGELVGYSREEMREVLQNEFCSKKGIEYFSVSTMKKNSCSKEIATEFIQHIIEHSINQGYNLILHVGNGQNRKSKSARELVPDVQRYVIACLRNKVCAVCGRIEADLHHWDNVNSIGGYKFDDGLKTRFISLCREHHNLFHAIGEKDFENKYHLQGVWLNPTMIVELKKIYKNHFKAFDEKNYREKI